MRDVPFWGFILNALSACVRTHPRVGMQTKGATCGPLFYFFALDGIWTKEQCVPQGGQVWWLCANRP